MTYSTSYFEEGDALYIDPGTGSLFLQAIIAALISIPIIFRDAMRSAFRRVSERRTVKERDVEPPA
jgi:hypothetical protein